MPKRSLESGISRIDRAFPRFGFLPFLYFAPLRPNARVLIVTDRQGLAQSERGLFNVEVQVTEPGKAGMPCDVLVVDVAETHPSSVARDMAHLLSPDGALIVCDRSRRVAAALADAPRLWLGRATPEFLGRRQTWEFLVEPGLEAPRFLVRPGFRSDIPTSSNEARWRRAARHLGLVYAMPHDTVRIYAFDEADTSPILSSLNGVNSGSSRRLAVRSIYVSPTELMVVRAESEQGAFFGRFPFSERALHRVRNAHDLQNYVRSTGCPLPPQPIALNTDGVVPYAIEHACPGEPWNGRDSAVASEAALKAIAGIHLAGESMLRELDEELFDRHIEARLALIEAQLGDGRMESIRQRLREKLLGKSVVISAYHGDFKLENCLFRRGEVSGIVDWDLGSREDLAILDVAHLHARLARKQPLTTVARRSDLFATGYEKYLKATRASFIPPDDLLLLWHVDQVAKESQHGDRTAELLEAHEHC